MDGFGKFQFRQNGEFGQDLVFYQELTIQEAAEVLALPVGTARTHYERGKARLRQMLLESREGDR